MPRITRAHLDAQADRLNHLTGSPLTLFSEGTRFNVGHYRVCGANGGFSLVRIVGTGGGEKTVIPRSTAGGLADLIRVYLQGVTDTHCAIAVCQRIVAFNMDECVDDNAEHEAIHDIKADAVKALRGLAGEPQ